jgi:hypothetical protein
MGIYLFMAAKRAKLAPDRILYVGLEPCKAMRDKYVTNFQHKAHCEPPKDWKVVEGSIESATTNPGEYTKGNSWATFSYCLHHCYHSSVKAFFTAKEVKESFNRIYALDVVAEHGWLKPFYTWADCESPENFDNVSVNGDWQIKSIWHFPKEPIGATAITNAWCACRVLENG